ncbi:MAG TPA: chromosomal replication initiator protein DnaA [Sandaracinaceae bacterium LLY-WYZ-13_1]|nr:chromosomal replication initiator protein DnaA [Sandaracinaceae bacterium LLY-WYZ-13_1]
MHHLWESALATLRNRLSEENYRTWLEPVQLEELAGRTVTLRIPNRFYADWISTHYLDLILDSLASETGLESLDVNWLVDEQLQKKMDAKAEQARRVEERDRVVQPTPSAPPPQPPSGPPADSGLNPKYRFDNFIVGPSNQLAHAASVAAASSPGTRYNPLFIYGGVGLGKTHLVNAIGHRVRQDRGDARVVFLSAERFTNEFIWALQNHRINEFRERYRTHCDVLCIDDIQFLAGREQTQEEFFHTFNALYHADRQIVVTSDVYPQQIKEMEERLISRFQWGLVADIQAPELDTRIAILKKKAEQEQIALGDDVALVIAQHVQSNVRELEGTLLRLAVKAELTKKPIDLEFAKEALGAVAPRLEKQASVEDIQRAACEYFNIRLSDLKSHRRHRAISFPRMVAMYVSRQRLKLSYPELGDRFGGKDHTTVMNACRKIKGLLEKEDQDVSTAIATIERKVGLS